MPMSTRRISRHKGGKKANAANGKLPYSRRRWWAPAALRAHAVSLVRHSSVTRELPSKARRRNKINSRVNMHETDDEDSDEFGDFASTSTTANSSQDSSNRSPRQMPHPFEQWIHCVCVVTFDLELGQALEVSRAGRILLLLRSARRPRGMRATRPAAGATCAPHRRTSSRAPPTRTSARRTVLQRICPIPISSHLVSYP